jgi:hypothetical protein
MDPFVFAAVLLAAACHAGWNATIKGGLDPLATTVLISIGAAIVAGAGPTSCKRSRSSGRSKSHNVTGSCQSHTSQPVRSL